MTCNLGEYEMDKRKMLIKEFRVVLPMTVEEYKVAQLWAVAEASKNETGGGEGIEIIKNEPFEDDVLGKGQYTYKIYHMASRAPKFIKLLAPKDSLIFHEEAWNAYPYSRTIVTNPGYMKKGFEIKIESWHKPDAGTSENVHKLPDKVYEKVDKILIDIANDPVSSADYKPEFDPKKVVSKKAGRGPLTSDWIKKFQEEDKQSSNASSESSTGTPHMCAYKLVSVYFKWWGLQNRVESLLQNQEHRLFTNFHRQVYGWMDEWFGMTMEDIRRIEDETQKDLDEMRKTGKIRGTVVDEE